MVGLRFFGRTGRMARGTSLALMINNGMTDIGPTLIGIQLNHGILSTCRMQVCVGVYTVLA